MPLYIVLSGLRLLFGLPIAGAVTVGLFMLMSGVLNHSEFPEPKDPVVIGSINAKLDPIDGPEPPDIIPSTIETTPPPVDTRSREGGDPVPGPIVTNKPIGPDGGEEGPITLQQVLTPIIRIEPAYPENCASRGVEGTVTVEFDISPQGAVVNPRIISASNRCFEGPTLRAVRGWKYSPTGRTTSNVRTNLTFRLAG